MFTIPNNQTKTSIENFLAQTKKLSDDMNASPFMSTIKDIQNMKFPKIDLPSIEPMDFSKDLDKLLEKTPRYTKRHFISFIIIFLLLILFVIIPSPFLAILSKIAISAIVIATFSLFHNIDIHSK